MSTFSAYEVATWARDAIRTLRAEHYPRPTVNDLYVELTKLSGVSMSHIKTFVRNPAYNITVTKLDRIIAAIKILQHRHATKNAKREAA